MNTEDIIMQQINTNRVVAFSKSDSPDRLKALDRLRAFGLVYEKPKHQWRLTDKGYNAVSSGFDKWLADNNEPAAHFTAENISIITGNRNKVNQSRFDSSRDISIKQTTNPITYENKQNAISSWLQKFWWQLLIPLIIGLLVLYIDKNW